MDKKLADRAFLALLIVMAVLLYSSTADYTGIAIKTSAKYVRFLAVFVGVLSAVQLGFSILSDRSNGKLVLTQNLPRFAGLTVAMVIFASTFEHLGFFIPAAIFIPTVALLLGFKSPVALGLTTFGVLAFVYLIFVQLLRVNLPGFNF